LYLYNSSNTFSETLLIKKVICLIQLHLKILDYWGKCCIIGQTTSDKIETLFQCLLLDTISIKKFRPIFWNLPFYFKIYIFQKWLQHVRKGYRASIRNPMCLNIFLSITFNLSFNIGKPLGLTQYLFINGNHFLKTFFLFRCAPFGYLYSFSFHWIRNS